MGVKVDVFETAELATVVVVIAALLLWAVRSWRDGRPPKGRRVRDIARRLENEGGDRR
jgi:hypothetical protein